MKLYSVRVFFHVGAENMADAATTVEELLRPLAPLCAPIGESEDVEEIKGLTE